MIQVTENPDGYYPERCCFCRAQTNYWYEDKDVACCPTCAQRAVPTDVPSQREWCTRENVAEAPLNQGVPVPANASHYKRTKYEIINEKASPEVKRALVAKRINYNQAAAIAKLDNQERGLARAFSGMSVRDKPLPSDLRWARANNEDKHLTRTGKTTLCRKKVHDIRRPFKGFELHYENVCIHCQSEAEHKYAVCWVCGGCHEAMDCEATFCRTCSDVYELPCKHGNDCVQHKHETITGAEMQATGIGVGA